MTKFAKLLTSSLCIAGILVAALPARAQQQQAASSKVPIKTVVTVLGPNYTAPPALGKSDVVVYTGKQREDVTGWVQAQGDQSALELAIVIDDGANINTQLEDVRNFIRAQSKATSVGLFYASSGMTETLSPFSTDHDAVAKKVRIAEGMPSVSASVYLALMDLIAKWHATGARREILLISDGIDRLHGDPSSPDVTETIQKAQRAGIMIHTVYARVGDREGRNLFRLNYGQSNLAQITDATGGEAFFQGLDTPISFGPYLAQLDTALHNQYFLTFTTAGSTKKKGEFRGFRVQTEQRNVEISAARAVFVPGP